MANELNQYILRLSTLAEDSKNPKLLWEEMQIISQKAFDLQEKIMAELDRIEQNETDITQIQAAFAARESIWDMMAQITEREIAFKEKTHRKETPAEREKRHKEALSESNETCTCGHHHDGKKEGCRHHHTHQKDCCCHGGQTCSET